MEVPKYISTLLQPPVKSSGRRVWSIPLEMVWVPFFTATNAVEATAIPHEALGAPLRLSYGKDGEVRFTKTGRPVLKVASELANQIRIVRENFVANLMSFTNRVATQNKDAYKAQVEASQKAAEHILAKMEEDLALAALVATPAAPQGEPEKVAA